MVKEIGFRYGMLCDDLEKQANAQGYTFGDNIDFVEELRLSANVVRINRLLTDNQADSMYQKLHKKIIKRLKSLNLNLVNKNGI